MICVSRSQDIGCGVGIVNGEVPGYRMSAHRIGLTIMPKYTDYANTSDTLELYVFNGGQQVSEKNFSFAWNGNTVTVTISSAEQPNMIYEITFWEDGVYSVKRSFDLGTG